MKKIFIILLLPVLTSCTLPFAITKSTTYKAKLEKYRSEAPSGYSFSVEQTYPYKLVRFPHKIIQVVGPNEVLACQVYSEIDKHNKVYYT